MCSYFTKRSNKLGKKASLEESIDAFCVESRNGLQFPILFWTPIRTMLFQEESPSKLLAIEIHFYFTSKKTHRIDNLKNAYNMKTNPK